MFKKVFYCLIVGLTQPLFTLDALAEEEEFVVDVSEPEDDVDAQEALNKHVLGWIENVAIYPGNFVLNAKLDSGADHCSLHAMNIEPFKKGGKDWVRFDIENRQGEKLTLERETHRIAKIKRLLGKPQERYVVRLGLCVGSDYTEVDVNLVDRSNFSYPVLIGRNFLAGAAMIDTSATYTQEPSCVVDDDSIGKKK